MSLHATNLDRRAEIIVEHFREHVRGRVGGRAKAMVVTSSRLHALRYYQALRRYIEAKGYDTKPPTVGVLVAFSGSLVDADTGATYTEAFLNGFPESHLPKRFESDEYQILIVAEKYQTGFDQPMLHTMYVDKKLSGVAAVQTLSRLNRVRPDKHETFVLDFANTPRRSRPCSPRSTPARPRLRPSRTCCTQCSAPSTTRTSSTPPGCAPPCRRWWLASRSTRPRCTPRSARPCSGTRRCQPVTRQRATAGLLLGSRSHGTSSAPQWARSPAY